MTIRKNIAVGTSTSRLLQAVLDNISDFVVVLKSNYQVICFNDLARATLAQIHNREIGIGVHYLDFVSEINKYDFVEAFQKALKGETTVREIPVKIGGEDVWHEIKLNPVRTSRSEIIGVTFTASNIDLRKKRELELKDASSRLVKFNRELTLLNKVNDLILSVEDEKQLLDDVCKCIVEWGGYRLAWVSYSAEGPMLEVKPIASFGQTGYLERIRISFSDPELANGPTVRTLTTGIKSITNNVENSDFFKPWLVMAQKYGIAASLVLPLSFGEETKGTLNIYAEKPDAFDEHEVRILERLAENLSLSIRSIRTRQVVLRTKHMLNERVKELSAIFNVHRELQNEITDKGETLSRIVQLLPPGWQYPEICSACITFEGVKHMTEGFRKTQWCQRAEFRLADGRVGVIEVAYSKQMPPQDEGPFLAEERHLINTIAATIEVFFNRASQRRELERSEARFRTAFEDSAIGMALVSLQGKWMMVNSALCKMVGYTQEELMLCGFQDITHPEDLAADVEALNEMRAGTRELYRREKRFLHKNGTTVWVTLNVALLKDKNGVPLYNVAQIENITERIESQMKFRDLVEQSLVGVYILQADRFAYVNPWVLQEFGYTSEELFGHSINEFILEEDQRKAKENIDARLNMQMDKVRYELRARRKDGSIVWLELFGSKTFYRGQVSIIGTMVDITDRKRLEAERRKIIADLVQRNRDITDFTQIVSHNLRGPLATMLGICRMVKDYGELPDFETISDGLLANAEKLDKVVRELDTALSIKGSYTGQVKNFLLTDVLEEVKTKLEEGIKAVSPEIVDDFDPGFEIRTVRSLFTDLISNIFSNCLLYHSHDRKCRIVISARKTNSEVVISISDNGIGINMKLYGDKLFGLNKRFHNIGNGTGLGLFMSKAMVEVLNGSIGLESEVGVGTTVTIRLPA